MSSIVAAAMGSVASASGQSGHAVLAESSSRASAPWPFLIVVGLLAVASVAIVRRIGWVAPRRASGTPIHTPRPVADAPALLVALAAAVFFGSFTLGPSLAMLLGANQSEPSLPDHGLTALSVYGIASLLCLGALVLARRADDALRPSISLRPRRLVHGAVCGTAAFLLAYPIVWIVGWAGRWGLMAAGLVDANPIAHATLDLLTAPPGAADPWWWAVIAGAVLGAPLLEETIFRGLLQPAVHSITRSPWIGILVSAGLFTVLHIPSSPDSGGATLAGVPTIAALAVALGIARARTGSLAVPLVMHIAFNALNVAMAFAVSQG